MILTFLMINLSFIAVGLVQNESFMNTVLFLLTIPLSLSFYDETGRVSRGFVTFCEKIGLIHAYDIRQIGRFCECMANSKSLTDDRWAVIQEYCSLCSQTPPLHQWKSLVVISPDKTATLLAEDSGDKRGTRMVQTC